jgi:hypothetical protein
MPKFAICQLKSAICPFPFVTYLPPLSIATSWPSPLETTLIIPVEVWFAWFLFTIIFCIAGFIAV